MQVELEAAEIRHCRSFFAVLGGNPGFVGSEWHPFVAEKSRWMSASLDMLRGVLLHERTCMSSGYMSVFGESPNLLLCLSGVEMCNQWTVKK